MAVAGLGGRAAFLDKPPKSPLIYSLRAQENPVLISLEELQLHPVSISKTYLPGELDYRTTEFEQIAELRIRGVAELVGSDIRFRGHLSTKVQAFCDRCLAKVQIPVEADLDLVYQPMNTIARPEEIEVSPSELEVAFFSGPGLELTDVIIEQVNLAIPMKIVCRPDCQGLCPTCGVNRNIEDCHCAKQSHESPFAALLGDSQSLERSNRQRNR